MLEKKLRYLKGVGPKKETLFNKLGVYTIKDLLYFFPFRYEDRRNFKKIKDLKEEETVLIKGKVVVRNLKSIPYFRRKRKVKSVFEAVISDGTGKVRCVWFNQAYLADLIVSGKEIIVYGKPSLDSGEFKFNSPEYELVSSQGLVNMGKIVGVYSSGSNFTQKFMRKIIDSVLYSYKSTIDDGLPFYIRNEKKFPNIAKSIESMHFPASWQEAQSSRERFIFEELFYSQILVYLRKARHRRQPGTPFNVRNDILDRIKSNLSFKLTPSQEEVVSQISNDLKNPYPMHRLLQGDVGCGKTIVAAFAMGICVDNKQQTAFMVPTEVLAYQHKETLENIFKGMGFSIEVITSSLTKAKITQIYTKLRQGKIDIIVGTHSLIQEDVKFKKLGLVVIDEQHKFGVAQRALLPKKAALSPHCLVMSATPIPRSLALSIYGDLDLSVIKEMPRGRIPPKTSWVKEKKREWVYEFLRGKLGGGRQVYIIYPVIEESQIQDLKSLEIMFDHIRDSFADFKVGMFHGRLGAKEKLDIIKDFREKNIDILVATTVVEVGVNIENATVMVVENPERFGLSQLHQLRGRIQRSNYQPYFIVLSKDRLSELSLRRLKVISEQSSGFEIAEEDLKLRGPGDFFGSMQHGLPKLKIANPLKDLDLLKQARTFAYKTIKSDPNLSLPQHRCIKKHLNFWLKGISESENQPLFDS